MGFIKKVALFGSSLVRTPPALLQRAAKMPLVYRAYNQVREELAEVGLLDEGIYLDEIELKVAVLASMGEGGYVFDKGAGLLKGFGFKGGTIYLPSDLPSESRKEGTTLTDIIRHEFGHAWYWLEPDFFARPWFEEAFGIPYDDVETTPRELFDEAIAPKLQRCKSARSSDALYKKQYRKAFASEYASTLACEDFCETFMLLLKYRKSLQRFQKRPELLRKLLIVREAVLTASEEVNLHCHLPPVPDKLQSIKQKEEKKTMNPEFTKLFKHVIGEVTEALGHANVLIVGSTGVGKSTLINAVFQGEMAATGDGVPVTQGVRAYTKKGVPLTIFDSRGLELEDFDASKAELLDEVRSRRKKIDSREHIHIAWLCISEDSRRVEEAHQHLAKELSEFMPVVVVITKSRMDDGFRATVQKLIPEARNVLSVRAIVEKHDDGHVSQPMGLENLVELTFEVFPEGHRRAFVAAQKVDLKRKHKHAIQAVALAATGAATLVGVNPIPAVDAMGLPAVYLAMFAGVNASYGLSISKKSLAPVVASAVSARVGMLAGPLIIGSMMKFIPVGGTLAGGLISGAAAGTIATTVGTIYVKVVHRLVKQNLGEPPCVDVLASELEKDLANRKKT